ncbi:TetR family transcriptional regulator [Prescottella subtropica]|uniref:TetR family transcriptional regulator n=1 Tax=Prescottella subtropica TaxID=2545757 RepID=UPI001F4FEADA|nr:TetR family transcriptional regulator [Prescottella subtropica]
MTANLPVSERLLRAGEYLFAREGIDRVRIRDLNTMAEVRNDSAVHYYFGSREGLLDAIVVRHMADVSARIDHFVERLCIGREPSESALRDAIATLAVPLGEKLLDERGRDFVQIMAEVYDRRGGLPDARYAPASAVAKDLVRRSMPGMSEALREERMRLTTNFIVSAMASWARAYGSGGPPLLDHETFVVNLIEMSTVAGLAPMPARPVSYL